MYLFKIKVFDIVCIMYTLLVSPFQVTPGDDFESERYLITVEAVKLSEKPSENQPKKAEAADRNGVKPALLPPRHLPVGLKRKFTVWFCSRFFFF